MNKVQHQKKKEVAKPVKPDDDCSCSSTDTPSSDCTPVNHPECCVELVKGRAHCQIKKVTHTYVVCNREDKLQYKWKHDEVKEEKWKPCHEEPLPKNCHEKPHHK